MKPVLTSIGITTNWNVEMKRSVIKYLVPSFLALSSNLVSAEQVFGTGAQMDKVISVAELMASPAVYVDKTVTVKGEVVKVCKKRGCWADLVTQGAPEKLTIKVKDGDMVFPMAAIGKTAYATGNLFEYQLSLEKTRDYLAHRAQENKEEFDPQSVTKGMTLYRLTPKGVTITP